MSASIYPTYPIGKSPAPTSGKKLYDCSICDDLPALEIEAHSEEEAKTIYLAAVIKALTLDKIEAVEVDIVG
ncbi:MAG TPA: hypothetical protein VF534_01295 [Paraburkholderia sp.]